MKIFYQNEKFTLYLGSAQEVLPEILPESIDLVIADPPYFLSNGGETFVNGKLKKVDKGSWDKSLGVKKDFEFHLNWIRLVKKNLRNTGSIWVSGTHHSIFQCGFGLQASGFKICNEIIWLKEKITPSFSKKYFTAGHESFVWAIKNDSENFVFNYEVMKNYLDDSDFLKLPDRQMHSVWRVSGVTEEEKKFGQHPTQKPEKIFERIILATSLEKQVVLDPFCGSGSVGVAALRSKRKFIGVDLDETFLDIAKKRLLEVS